MKMRVDVRLMALGGSVVLGIIGGWGAEGLAQPANPVPGQVGPPAGFPVMHRACKDDQFFIDVPIWANPGWASASIFAASLRTAINNVKRGYWFCPGTTCDNATATVTSLLPARPSTDQSWRNDGDRRFFRVKFSRRNSSGVIEPLSVRPDRICEAVAAIRGAAQAQAGAVPLFVGRECDASTLGSLESQPSQEMIDWPKVAMGVPVNQTIGSGNVDLALIDSGVDPAVAAAADVQIAEQRSFVSGSASLHPHGTAMALFLRQLAPQARIFDARVLASDGHGLGQNLALAIDWALFEKRRRSRPMVLSLSLGWPVHDSDYAWVGGLFGTSGATCSDWESPFGEPIRYLLTGARRGGIANVVAAAGNNPTTGDFPHVVSTPFAPAPLAAPPGCAAPNDTSRWLYPARWDDQPSCFSDGVTRYAALGASAVDSRRQVASTGIPNQEALIVAPGEHVYAKHPAAAVNTGALFCTTNSEPAGVSLPRVFSGSSVSGAYVAGAIARAQDLWINKTGTALTPIQAQKLVYLTGQTLCREAGADQYTRMVSVPRLEAAIANQSCGNSLLSCDGNGELSGWQTYTNCTAALVTCGLEPAGPPTCVKAKDGVDWPAGYTQPICDGVHTSSSAQTGQCQPGDPLSCPYEELPSAIELGSFGPQPVTGGCPECRLTCSNGTSPWVLKAQLSNYFPGTTNLTLPMLAISKQGSSTTTWVNLTPSLSPASVWKIGAYVQVNIPAYMIPLSDCTSLVGNFWITQNSSGFATTQNFSALKFFKP